MREVAALADVALLGDVRPGKFSEAAQAIPLDSPLQPDGTPTHIQSTISDLKKQQKGKRKAQRDREKAVKSYESTFSDVAARAANANPTSSARLRDAPGSRPLDEVVLCGGSSKTPMILRLLTSLTGVVPTYIPRLAIASHEATSIYNSVCHKGLMGLFAACLA